ncbi:Exocyst complex component 1 [Intoshia linei]|uniref:Exocyst complex component 1 n=1 Tax=Intoshia linei TaxID=1819745 RepID=A0A177B759_9BILA|nr:Exocyst complex component 1 [Intoshia linei]
MTTVKSILQREFFYPLKERLISAIRVSKTSNRKYSKYMLCMSVSNMNVHLVRISMLKYASKSNTYKQKDEWNLSSIISIEGSDNTSDKVGISFEFINNQNLSVHCEDETKKRDYLANLYQLCCRTLDKMPEFYNMPLSIFDEKRSIPHEFRTENNDDKIQTRYNLSESENRTDSLLSEEASNIIDIMNKYDLSIKNVDTFSIHLKQQLDDLDGENIHTIIESENRIGEIMKLIDNGLDIVNNIEDKLDVFDKKLMAVQDLMESAKDKDYILNLQNKNFMKLRDVLEMFINVYNIGDENIKTIENLALSTDEQVLNKSYKAIKKLTNILKNAEIDPNIKHLYAYKNQINYLESLKKVFIERFVQYIHSIFNDIVNKRNLEISLNPSVIISIGLNEQLEHFIPFMVWLYSISESNAHNLKNVYIQKFSKLYENYISQYFKTLRSRLLKNHKKVNIMNINSKSDISQDGSSKTSDYMEDDAIDFDQVFSSAISFIKVVTRQEEIFVVNYFNIYPDLNMNDKEIKDTNEYKKKILLTRKLLFALFENLESELKALCDYGHSLSRFNTVLMHSILQKSIVKRNDSEFLIIILNNCLHRLDENMENLIESECRNVIDYKPSKKVFGIFPFVKNFENYIHYIEELLRELEHRKKFDKLYSKLYKIMSVSIIKLSNESSKVYPSLVCYENFYLLSDVIQCVNLDCLKEDQRDAHQKSQIYLTEYVKHMLGRPIERLGLFCEGIDSLLDTGVPPSEVMFKIAFSKNELKKIIVQYPGRIVKESLARIYRKVRKHLSVIRLANVVWLEVQHCFLKQYDNYQKLLNLCYGDIKLDFTVSDVLDYFSDIVEKDGIY